MKEFPAFWTEVVPNLYISGFFEWPHDFKGLLVCVLEERPMDEPNSAMWIPILDKDGWAMLGQLDTVADIIRTHIDHGPVVIHCNGGVDRSPLVVAWYLFRQRNMSLNEAYALIKEKRHIVVDRTGWLRSGWADASR